MSKISDSDLSQLRTQESEEQLPSRRDFLKQAGTAAAVIAVTSPFSLRANNAIANKNTPAQEEDQAQDHDHAPENHEHQKLDPRLDIGTAGVVAGAFGVHVFVNGAARGIPLNKNSAIQMNALAMGRIAALNLFGGEEGKHLAKEELGEIEHGLLPLPVLVALSDMTTTELKVNSDKIFSAIEGSLEKTMDYKKINRPSLGADITEWQTHLEGANKDLTSKISQIAAITTVLAPLGTTYTSSSLANMLKEYVLRILFEQSYAKAVIKRKQQGEEVIEKAECEEEAFQRADTLFNGAFGYSKLMFTLAANTNGSFGLGDPPEVYFLMDYIKDPKILLAAHSIGLANSEFYTILLNTVWMIKAGIARDIPTAIKDFGANQVTTLKALGETLGNSDLRNTSFRGGRKFLQPILEALDDTTDPTGKLRSTLQQIPQTYLEFNFGKYIDSKIDFITKKAHRVAQIDPHSIKDIENFESDPQFTDLLKLAQAEKDEEVITRLKALEEKFKDIRSSELTGLFEVILKESLESQEANSTENVDTTGTTLSTPEQVEHIRIALRKIQELTAGLTPNTPKDEKLTADEKIERADEAVGIAALQEKNPQSAQDIYSILNQPDEETAARAIAKLASKNGKTEDVIPGMSDHTTTGEDVNEAMHHEGIDHKISFLSHSAQEVLFALLTQIPSVPAISRLAKLGLPKLAGVKDGETPSAQQLKNINRAMLPIEAGMSAFADNVAAYIFARNVLLSFFERTFGEEVWTEFPNLNGTIGIITKLLAEQAGSLSQVGNGPNFSQEKCILLRDENNPQGVSIDRVQMRMGDSLPHKNMFSTIANTTLVGLCMAHLEKLIDEIDAKRATPAEIRISRREALNNLFRNFGA